MDISFILENEANLVLPAVVKDDYQKADNSVAPTQLWSFFFKESFLNQFQRGRARPGPWQFNNVDVCRRHAWDRREGMPLGWEKGMNGFRVWACVGGGGTYSARSLPGGRSTTRLVDALLRGIKQGAG